MDKQTLTLSIQENQPEFSALSKQNRNVPLLTKIEMSPFRFCLSSWLFGVR